MPVKNMIGQTIGRLTVIERAKKPGHAGLAVWKCTCTCGQEVVVSGDSLRNGHTRSCGCLRREFALNDKRTHGMRDAREYSIWRDIVRRCTDPRRPEYDRYGARGITICDRWLKFENFYSDMGPNPTVEHSIDRINNDGNYEPGNCRWATRFEQARNTRANKLNEASAMQIRWLRIDGGYSTAEIASAFGVRVTLVRSVASGRSWKGLGQ